MIEAYFEVKPFGSDRYYCIENRINVEHSLNNIFSSLRFEMEDARFTMIDTVEVGDEITLTYENNRKHKFEVYKVGLNEIDKSTQNSVTVHARTKGFLYNKPVIVQGSADSAVGKAIKEITGMGKSGAVVSTSTDEITFISDNTDSQYRLGTPALDLNEWMQQLSALKGVTPFIFRESGNGSIEIQNLSVAKNMLPVTTLSSTSRTTLVSSRVSTIKNEDDTQFFPTLFDTSYSFSITYNDKVRVGDIIECDFTDNQGQSEAVKLKGKFMVLKVRNQYIPTQAFTKIRVAKVL